MYGYIYKTTNLINGKIYIGQKHSSKFLGERYLGSGKRLKDAIKCYGDENFKVELIEEVESKDLMDEREIYWIKYYNVTNKEIGYNLSEGGNVNRTLVGENNPFYGKHHSEETLKHLSNVRTGKKHKSLSEKHKQIISRTHKGKQVSEETRKKLSDNAKVNYNYGMKGKHVSEETKKKLRLAHLGKQHASRGYIHITNDIEDKMINPSEFEYYQTLGWRRGRKKFSDIACKNISEGHKGHVAFNKNMIWITDGIKDKLIDKNQIIEEGWRKGRTHF